MIIQWFRFVLAKAAVTSVFGGKRCIRTKLSSSQSEEITFDEDEIETASRILYNILTVFPAPSVFAINFLAEEYRFVFI